MNFVNGDLLANPIDVDAEIKKVVEKMCDVLTDMVVSDSCYFFSLSPVLVTSKIEISSDIGYFNIPVNNKSELKNYSRNNNIKEPVRQKLLSLDAYLLLKLWKGKYCSRNGGTNYGGELEILLKKKAIEDIKKLVEDNKKLVEDNKKLVEDNKKLHEKIDKISSQLEDFMSVFNKTQKIEKQ